MLDFGLQIHRIVKLKYNSGYFIERHSHDFFHYIYVFDGVGQIQINETMYDAVKGELYLIPVQTEHEIHSLENLTTINIKFTCNSSFTKMLNCARHRVNDLTAHEVNIIKDVLNEAICSFEYSEELMNIRFTELLLNILRKHKQTNSSREHYAKKSMEVQLNQVNIGGDLCGIIKYIHENVDKLVVISQLAELAGYSESYFCTLFKSKYGITPVQYINNIKIERAKDLILFSNRNITQISKMLGFGNIHYFSRLFKKVTSLSPQEYMKKLQGDIVVNVINDSIYIPKSRYEYPQKRKMDKGS